MNNKFVRIISSLLIMIMLFSAVAVVIPAAEDTSEPVSGEGVTLLMYRSFDEGWDYNNGLGKASKGHKFYIDYEETEEFTYNYFMRCEAVNGTDDFTQFSYKLGQPRSGGSYFSFDIKADDFADFNGDLIYTRGIDGTTTKLVAIKNNQLLLPNTGVAKSAPGKYITKKLADRWIRVVFAYNLGPEEGSDEADPNDAYRVCTGCGTKYGKSSCSASKKCTVTVSNKECGKSLDPAAMDTIISTRVYVGYADEFDVSKATAFNDTNLLGQPGTFYYDTALRCKAGEEQALEIIRIGFPAQSSQSAIDYMKGQSYCIDNVLVYNGPIDNNKPEGKVLSPNDVESLGQSYGTHVIDSAQKTVEILKDATAKSDMQYVRESLVMKVGVSKALYANKRENILSTSGGAAYGAPVKIDGKVFVPFDAVLKHIGYPYYMHEDGKSYDFSTSAGSALLTLERDTAMVNGELISLNAAPKSVKDKATGESYVVVAMEDVETLFGGYYVTYDDMGLIIIGEKDNVVDRDYDLAAMISLMCDFIYDYETANEYYTKTAAKTSNFQHPYLFANQSDFDYYYQVYSGTIKDETLKKYLIDFENNTITYTRDSKVRVSESEYLSYRGGWSAWVASDVNVDPAKGAITTGDRKYLTGTLTTAADGAVLNGSIVNPQERLKNENDAEKKKYYNGGYDFDGGRLDESARYASQARSYALLYQITRKEPYARVALEILVALADWTHWGHEHMLNAADATTSVATTYDWLYNVWKDWGKTSELAKIERAIYEKGVLTGAQASGVIINNDTVNGITGLRKQGSNWKYTTMTNNWNAVCTSGVVIGALIAMSNPSYKDVASQVISSNTETLAKNGLAMYAPDGSYIESPNYWVYATTSLYNMIWALNTAVGDDMGFLDMWAMDKTFFFACHIEFPSYVNLETGASQGAGYQFWNYHDSNQDYMDSCMFFYAAEVLGEKSLAAIRIQHLERKAVTLYDILAYDPTYATLDVDVDSALDELDLTYVLEACDGIVSREKWADGTIYTGLMGNRNDVSHGQIDSGNFIYANKNYVWFADLGCDDYNVKGYWDNDYRYSYYRNSAEGNNVVAITSLPSSMPDGQRLEAGGELISYEANEYGMKAIIDNKAVYNEDVVNEASRGILFTNNRQTVVIQDKIVCAGGVQDFVWLGQTAANIDITNGGKTAFLTKDIAGKTETIRVTLVSPFSAYEFVIKDAYDDFVLSATHKDGDSERKGGVAEKDRSQYKRLCVESKRAMSFVMAIVIESVPNKNVSTEDMPVQYTYTDNMNEWRIEEKYVPVSTEENIITTPKPFDIVEHGEIAHKYMEDGTAFTINTEAFYIAMAKAAAAVIEYSDMLEEEKIKPYYEDYVKDRDMYRGFRNDMNKSVIETMSIGVSLGGFFGVV